MFRDLQSTWHAAFWATACLFAQLIFAAGARADDPPGTRIVSVRSVYTFADGRQVVVEESTQATKAAAAASSNGCQKCGDKCDCVGGCGCEATSWLATCGAAPVVRAKVPCDAQGNAPPVRAGGLDGDPFVQAWDANVQKAQAEGKAITATLPGMAQPYTFKPDGSVSGFGKFVLEGGGPPDLGYGPGQTSYADVLNWTPPSARSAQPLRQASPLPATYTSPPPPPVIYPTAPPAYYSAPVYMAPPGYRSMPAGFATPNVYTPARSFGAGFGVRGPFGGGFQAGACVGGT